MHDDQEGRASDKDELQGPESDVGDGEKLVIADVGAARLPRVAVKVLLLISPYTLSCHHVDQHTENEDHREPDAAKSCGVFVDPAEQRLQCFPVHGSWWRPEQGQLCRVLGMAAKQRFVWTPAPQADQSLGMGAGGDPAAQFHPRPCLPSPPLPTGAHADGH
uniref:Uncharacterized protein n=1 Tax=Falco tinnunculus TaxID=100819 RepID=A0A8C4XPL0_FALTI